MNHLTKSVISLREKEKKKKKKEEKRNIFDLITWLVANPAPRLLTPHVLRQEA